MPVNGRSSIVEDLTKGPLTKQMVLFSIPLILGNVLQTLYTMVDMAIVGRFCGRVGLAAVSTSGQLLMLLYGLGMALGVGCQILIAQQIGGGDRSGAATTIGTGFTLTALVSTGVAVLSIVLRRPLLALMNVPQEAAEAASAYMFWCAIGVPFNSVCSSMGSILRGLGDSRHPMIFMAVSAAINVVLDYVLVALLGMEAAGAAIATTAAQIVGCLYCLGFMCRRRESLGIRLEADFLKMDPAAAGIIVRLAAPLAVQTASINLSMMVINAWINAYGVVASAVAGVGSKLYSLNSIVSGAMMTAEATFTGQNIAAGRHDRLRRSMKTALLFSLAFWGISLIGCLALPREIFSLFTSDAEVLAMAPDYMHIMIVMYLGFALISPVNGFLNGIGNVRLGLIIALVDGVAARLTLSFLLARVCGMGLYGYWLGSSLAGFVTVIWGWLYYGSGRWRERKLLVN